MVNVTRVETPELGDRSYVVDDGVEALVVDPQRDFDRVLEVAATSGVRITAVAETHLHNDYVSGGLALATQVGARYLVSGEDQVSFERVAVAGGDQLAVGSFAVEAIPTPGHTPTHLSYLVKEGGHSVAVFSGGSLLYGTVGRTDLVSAERAGELTRAQYHSARLLAQLGAEVAVWPTHGFGSFCSSASSSGSSSSTIGDERAVNVALTTEDEDEFVRSLLAGLAAYPRYYAHMGPRNRQGAVPADLSPPAPVNPEELRRRVAAGEWVVDLRRRVAFARGHLPGTVGVELSTSFATYLGWTIPWGLPVTLLGGSADQVAHAQRDLARIGIDRPAGAAVGSVEDWAGGSPLATYDVVDFPELARRLAGGHEGTVLDVRRADEWQAGHATGAVHVPLQDLVARMAEVPDGKLYVHCASGFRASIAASLLDGAGRDVTLVDDDVSGAAAAGVPWS